MCQRRLFPTHSRLVGSLERDACHVPTWVSSVEAPGEVVDRLHDKQRSDDRPGFLERQPKNVNVSTSLVAPAVQVCNKVGKNFFGVPKQYENSNERQAKSPKRAILMILTSFTQGKSTERAQKQTTKCLAKKVRCVSEPGSNAIPSHKREIFVKCHDTDILWW